MSDLRHIDDAAWHLFQAIEDCACLVERLPAGCSESSRYRFIAMNESMADMFGIPDLSGSAIEALFSEETSEWHDDLDWALEIGRPLCITRRMRRQGRSIATALSPVNADGKQRLLALFRDISSKRLSDREETPARSQVEELNAFLVNFSDTVRAVLDPDAIAATACRLIAQRLRVERAYWATVDWTSREYVIGFDFCASEAAPIAGRFPIDAWEPFTSLHLAGRPVVVHDVAKDVRVGSAMRAGYSKLGIAADLAVPVIVGGQLKSVLAVNQREPRHWSPDEVALVHAVADRCWVEVERARTEAAVREGQERLALAMEVGELASWDWDLRSDRVEWNDRHFLLQGYAIGEVLPSFESWAARVHPEDRAHSMALIARARQDRALYVCDFRTVHPDGTVRWSAARGRFFYDPQGVPYRMIGVMEDISSRKLAEQAAKESEERQAFLLRFSDALRAEPDVEAVALRALSLLIDQLRLDRSYITTYRPEDDRADVTYQMGNDRVPPLPETFVLSSYPEAYRIVLEQTFVVNDDYERRGLSEAERLASNQLGMRAMLASTIRRGDRVPLWSMMAISAQPRNWTSNEITLVEEVAERTWLAMDRSLREAALRASQERFLQFAKASAAGLWIRDAETLDMEFTSPAISSIYGLGTDALLGDIKLWASMIVPEERQSALDHLMAAREGKTQVHQFRILRPDTKQFRWIKNTDFPLIDQGGRVERIGGIAEDITESRMAIEHQAVLLAELQHRVRNIMAVISVIAARTGESAASVEDYAKLMAGRLHTLARVQSLLTRGANVGVSLRQLVQDELSAKAHRPAQYVLDGPDLTLKPKAAEVLTLAVHELATNALKYGALAAPDGRVQVAWSTSEQGDVLWLRFEWIESGVAQQNGLRHGVPRRRGFGSDLIEGRIPYELKGRGKVTFEPEGARCLLEFPLTDGASLLETSAPTRPASFGGSSDMSSKADLAGQRILVVEDDYYLAADMTRALRSAGAEVLGPCAGEEEANRELSQTSPTAALVDINLGYGPSFVLAHSLLERGVPFIFVTGYDEAVIPRDFESVARLQKPVDFELLVNALTDLSADAN